MHNLAASRTTPAKCVWRKLSQERSLNGFLAGSDHGKEVPEKEFIMLIDTVVATLIAGGIVLLIVGLNMKNAS